MKIWFFPGLGADASLARFHPLPGYNVSWVEWPKMIPPAWEAFLDALQAENRIEPGAVFIGISFGGMAAQKLAERIRPKGIILIGSMTTRRSLTFLMRTVVPLSGLLPPGLNEIRYLPRPIAAAFFGVKRPEHLALLYGMGKRIKGANAKRLIHLALNFAGERLEGVPMRSIHGDQDRIIRANAERRDEIVPGGGHLISMTHPDPVNATLLRWLTEFAG